MAKKNSDNGNGHKPLDYGDKSKLLLYKYLVATPDEKLPEMTFMARAKVSVYALWIMNDEATKHMIAKTRNGKKVKPILFSEVFRKADYQLMRSVPNPKDGSNLMTTTAELAAIQAGIDESDTVEAEKWSKGLS